MDNNWRKFIKILHVIANLSPRTGGPPKVCVEMAQGLVARGHEVDIFTTDQDGPSGRMDVPTDRPVNAGGVNIHYFRANLRPCISWDLFRALQSRIHEYDIVHNHSLYLFHGSVSAFYCRKHGIPYLIRPCGSLDPYIFQRHRYRKVLFEYLFERRNIQHSAAMHFTTREERQLAQKNINFKKGVVIPLGIPLEDYENFPMPEIFRQKFPEIGNRKIILFLGRINFKKGLDLLIPAFARISRTRDDVHLVLAGPDNEGYAKKVIAWVHDEGMGDRISLTGMIDGEIKIAALREASLFVLPSYSENFGIAVIEAMASSLPVVISKNVNIWREIEMAGAGLVGDCNEIQLKDMMQAILDDQGKAEEMGRAGRKLVESDYTWPNLIKLMEATYVSLLSSSVRRFDSGDKL